MPKIRRIFYIFVKIYYVLTKFQCKIVFLRFLNKQCRVAETEKSVFHIDRGFVHIHHVFIARKSAHVHDKRAFRQMKIRYHSFQNFEFVAGINENLCLAVSGVNETVFVGNRFKNAAGSCTDCNHSPPFFHRFVYDFFVFFRQFVIFAMHFVVSDFFRFYRTERPKSHVQQYFRKLDALGFQTFDKFGREMKPCRGRSRAAVDFAVNGVVS